MVFWACSPARLSLQQKDKRKKGAGLRSDVLELYHRCLQEILRELVEIQESDSSNGEGYCCYVAGKGKVHLHFEVAIVIGDTVGHDAICCHYQSYTNKIERPVRSCTVSQDDIDNENATYSFVHMADIFDRIETCMSKIMRRRKVDKYRKAAKKLSQSLVISAFSKVSFGGDPTGIFGATPFEVLHCLLLGLLKYTLNALFNFQLIQEVVTDDGEIKSVTRKPFKTSIFEQRLRVISMASKRQSDRNMPRSVFNCGVTSLAGINGQEYIGLSALTIVALPGLLSDIAMEKQFAKCIWKGVSLYTLLTRDLIPKHHVDHTLSKQLTSYIRDFNTVVGPQREITSPDVGNKLSRLHGLLHFVRQIQRDGVPNNSNGAYLEKSLKEHVKHPAGRTRKTHSDFNSDLIKRISEFKSIDEHAEERWPDGLFNSDENSTPTQSEHDCISVGPARFKFVRSNRQWTTKAGRRTITGVVHPFLTLNTAVYYELSRLSTQKFPALLMLFPATTNFTFGIKKTRKRNK